MSEYRIASRYAKSLLDLSVEKGELEQVNNDMQLLVNLASENRDLVLMLKSPIITHDKKLAVLNKVFTGKVSELTMAFFKILTKKHREAYLVGIAKEFHHQYNAHKGIEEATVTTTFPLNDAFERQPLTFQSVFGCRLLQAHLFKCLACLQEPSKTHFKPI